MSLPSHTNPTTEVALAPYNFVPLPEQVVTVSLDDLPCQDIYKEGLHTGYIDLVLTTESPLYIRCPLPQDVYERQARGEDEQLPPEKQAKNRPDFFYTDPSKTPRIPGSSLRGMLRTLVEIVGFGKFEDVGDEPLVYRAVGDTTSHGLTYRQRIMQEDSKNHFTPLVQAGYIRRTRRGDWEIQPAQAINGVSFARINLDKIPERLALVPGCKNAATIYVEVGPYDYQEVKGGFLNIKYSKVVRAEAQPGRCPIKATLAHSGAMISKRSEAVVFPEDTNATPIEIDERLVAAYRDQISQEQEDLLGKDGVLREGQPVFYLLDATGGLVFFGHTMMMRLPYDRTPLDFVPDKLRDRRSEREKSISYPTKKTIEKNDLRIDLAEAIFGFTKDQGRGKACAYASRVFVGDATLEPNQSDIWLTGPGHLTPRILGSPKPTTFQHYLTQPTPDPKQVGRTKDGRLVYRKDLKTYADTTGQTTLRGYKFYWHKGSVDLDFIREMDLRKISRAPKQYTRMRPVRAGVTFRGRIYLENLSPKELGALLWALTLPGEKGREYRHKLGMAKPHGMGALKVSATLHLDDRQARYTALFDSSAEQLPAAPIAWHTPTKTASADEIGRFIAAFEAAIPDTIRVEMLLRMMEWPGPPREQTRYLEIERIDPTARRGKVNEYKIRPVLPDPFSVEPDRARPQPTRPARQPAASPLAAEPDAPPQPGAIPGAAPPQAAPEVWRPATVRDYDATRMTGILVDDSTPDQALRFIWDKNVDRGWSPGRRARVEYVGVEKDGRVVVLKVRRLR